MLTRKLFNTEIFPRLRTMLEVQPLITTLVVGIFFCHGQRLVLEIRTTVFNSESSGSKTEKLTALGCELVCITLHTSASPAEARYLLFCKGVEHHTDNNNYYSNNSVYGNNTFLPRFLSSTRKLRFSDK